MWFALKLVLPIVLACASVPAYAQYPQLRSGNPILPGWYADPEAHVFRNEFERVGKILQQDPLVATGAGHHSVLHRPGSSRWYIVYRPLGEVDRDHRVVCIDELHFADQGLIKPITITKDGVRRDPLP